MKGVLSLVMIVAASMAAANDWTINLAGPWRCELDRRDEAEQAKRYEQPLQGTEIRLPGSLQENGLGDDPSVDTQWTGGIIDRSWFNDDKYAPYRAPGQVKVPFWLTPIKHYVGPAWYERIVTIPDSWKDRRAILSFERAHWTTKLWIDGDPKGEQVSLMLPHQYDLGSLPPGEHRITVRVDNRLYVDVGENAHSVSDHTQSNWNGLIGRLELRAMPSVYLTDVQVYPDVDSKTALIKLALSEKASAIVTLAAESGGPNRYTAPPITMQMEGGEASISMPLGDKAPLWDEFNPALFQLAVTLKTNSGVDTKTVSFGLRSFTAPGRNFLLNGRPVFLRGTLECCIFPKTGYPPTDVDAWRRIMSIIKAHGLNHMRFHSWCPPAAAFDAADEAGVFFQVEGPFWASVGGDKPVNKYVYEECDRILKAFSNHPSFCMLAYGNEPGGTAEEKRIFLAALVDYWKSKETRQLFTSGSGWPVIPENQYHVSHEARLNGRDWFKLDDYREIIQKYPIPYVSHEIGQWCVYPNVDEIAKYTGVLRAGNMEIFRDFLNNHGLGDMAHDFLMASGRLQTLAYKEELEMAFRTPEYAGFQMLDLHDFPGQGSALVGMLDAFWDSKPYVSPAEIRRFIGPTVALLRLPKHCFTADETLDTTIECSHFGPVPLENVDVAWQVAPISGGEGVSGQFTLPTLPFGSGQVLGRLVAPMSRFAAPAQLRATVTIRQGGNLIAENDWNLWVYPDTAPTPMPSTIRSADALDQATLDYLAAGGSVLLTPKPGTLADDGKPPVCFGFQPIFWNSAWFPSLRERSLGILCDPKISALAAFPTEYHSDWQWAEALKGAQAFWMDPLPKEVRPLVWLIDDWFTARKLGLLFETRVGNGKLLFAGFDLAGDLTQRPVLRQLRESLLQYMAGPDFNPTPNLSPDQLQPLFRKAPATAMLVKSIHASSAQNGFGPENLLDGNPLSLWHTPWEGQVADYPHELTLEFKQPLTLRAIKLLPRQDNNPNGLFTRCEIFTAGKTSKPVLTKLLDGNAAEKTLEFGKPITTKGLRIVATRGLPGQAFASLAELELILEK